MYYVHHLTCVHYTLHIMYGEQVLREMVCDTLRSCAPHTYSGKRIKMSPIAEGALNSFIVRLRHGRNARNALMLLRRIGNKFSKVLYLVTLYRKYTRALTFEF